MCHRGVGRYVITIYIFFPLSASLFPSFSLSPSLPLSPCPGPSFFPLCFLFLCSLLPLAREQQATEKAYIPAWSQAATDNACTANPTWGDIFKCCFKAQSSKLESLFSLKRGKRDVRALSFELSKTSPQVGLAVHTHLSMSIHEWSHMSRASGNRERLYT